MLQSLEIGSIFVKWTTKMKEGEERCYRSIIADNSLLLCICESSTGRTVTSLIKDISRQNLLLACLRHRFSLRTRDSFFYTLRWKFTQDCPLFYEIVGRKSRLITWKNHFDITEMIWYRVRSLFKEIDKINMLTRTIKYIENF